MGRVKEGKPLVEVFFPDGVSEASSPELVAIGEMDAPVAGGRLEAGYVGELSSKARGESLRLLREGTLQSVLFKAKVFTNTTRNRNHMRFFDRDMGSFAASFVGAPFLRDHDTSSIDSREGTIRASRMDGDWLVQEVELTTGRGMQAYLEGQIDRFSIGWFYQDVVCSVCDTSWLSGDCHHVPGREYPKDGEVGGKAGKAGAGQRVRCELMMVGPEGKEVSAVNAPAVPGTGLLAQLMAAKEGIVANRSAVDAVSDAGADLEDGELAIVPVAAGTVIGEAAGLVVAAPQPIVSLAAVAAAQPDPWLAQGRQVVIDAKLVTARLSIAGLAAVKAQLELFGEGASPELLDRLIEVQQGVERAMQVTPVRGMSPRLEIETPADLSQKVVNWLMGVEGAAVPPGNYRKISDLYTAMTHDYDWHGGKWGVHPDSTLAAATTTALPALVVNALQKVLLQVYGNMEMWRWYEKIASPMPHDGSTQNVTMISLGGMPDLPVVGEGQAYPERGIVDRSVQAAFTKFGAYIGITLEMIRKNDIAKMQMIPREMMNAAVRTRSSVVAEIFKMASGLGPTMSYDSLPLFENATHGNLSTAAFSYAEWGNVRQKIAKQVQFGSNKRLGFLPRFCLVPVELFDVALNVFGYGAGNGGLPGTPNNDLNVYAIGHPGDPRPEIIHVPEFTDATDWAALVAPADSPVIQIAYANNPPGGTHPTPEIFTVDGPGEGLMFSNDTMPIKIRDWWSVGVASHIGIHKSNVAG